MVRRQNEWQTAESRSRAWVALGWFWAVVLVGLVAGAVVLQVLGPPPAAPPAAAAAPPPAPEARAPELAPPPAPAAVVAAPPAPEARAPELAPPPAPAAVVAAPPAPEARAPELAPPPAPPAARTDGIPAPIAALQEPGPEGPGATLPRIGADGTMPMQAYAAAFDAADKRPRVAVLLAGIGMAEADSEDAIRTTPAAVSLAFSPYATRPGPLATMARAAGHETLASVPMEPVGFPQNDAGNHALLTGLAPAENQARLDWALSRIAGTVGATAMLGKDLMGERFAASEQMAAVLEALAGRGLLYIDPRPPPALPAGPAPVQPGVRRADLVIDDPAAVRPEIEARLARLEQLARDRGSALGLAGRPDPVTVDRLAAWAATLAARGVVLVPVSALVAPLSPPAKASP